MAQRAAAWHGLQTWGYRPEHLMTDVSLALVSGTESVLWGCTFAAMIFAGPLSAYLPIAIVVFLLSNALIVFVVALGSHQALHLAAIDEQAVAVMATIAIAAGARWGQFTSPGAGAATLFIIMAAISIVSGLALLLAARFNLGPLIQLVPFPVVCGFLAGLGWLLFVAAIAMLTDVEPTLDTYQTVLAPDVIVHWWPALAGGFALFVALHLKDHFLVLPAALLAAIALFYGIASWNGVSLVELRETGWVFHFETTDASLGLSSLDFANIDFGFILSVLPEMAMVVVLSLLNVSFNLSALEVVAQRPLPLKNELQTLATANVASGLVGGLPGTSDIVASATFGGIGVTSRLFALTEGSILLATAIGGAFFLEYVPKVVIGAIVFFAGIHLMYEWLIEVRHKMTVPEAFAVWSIFAVIAAVGFIPGVVLGIVLTSLLFIVRYSGIDVVDSAYFLDQMASSVDRPSADQSLLQHYGKTGKIFNLRGFLFFGTASLYYEELKRLVEQEERYEYVVLNFHRVTGMDSTAVQVFFKIVNFLESIGAIVVFCGMSPQVRRALTEDEDFDSNRFLIRDTLDSALMWVEEHLLVTHEPPEGPQNIREIVLNIIGDQAKADWLVAKMQRREIAKDQYLFRQGDRDTNLYIIESGMIEVRLESAERVTRLRDFCEGTVIGEMAAYSDEKTRSAAALATTSSVVYCLTPEKMAETEGNLPILHEFVARLLVARLIFMNKRLDLGL